MTKGYNKKKNEVDVFEVRRCDKYDDTHGATTHTLFSKEAKEAILCRRRSVMDEKPVLGHFDDFTSPRRNTKNSCCTSHERRTDVD
jgi:hypothetical protein